MKTTAQREPSRTAEGIKGACSAVVCQTNKIEFQKEIIDAGAGGLGM